MLNDADSYQGGGEANDDAGKTRSFPSSSGTSRPTTARAKSTGAKTGAKISTLTPANSSTRITRRFCRTQSARSFNRVGTMVDSVSGQVVGNRQKVQFLAARRQGVVKKNELPTAAAKWFRQQCDGEDEETDAFRDLVVCGMGWTETRLNYEYSPEGDPRAARGLSHTPDGPCRPLWCAGRGRLSLTLSRQRGF
jgi:hypothetical protein